MCSQGRPILPPSLEESWGWGFDLNSPVVPRVLLHTQWIIKSLFPLVKSNSYGNSQFWKSVCGQLHFSIPTAMWWPGSRSLKTELENQGVTPSMNCLKVQIMLLFLWQPLFYYLDCNKREYLCHLCNKYNLFPVIGGLDLKWKDHRLILPHLLILADLKYKKQI